MGISFEIDGIIRQTRFVREGNTTSRAVLARIDVEPPVPFSVIVRHDRLGRLGATDEDRSRRLRVGLREWLGNGGPTSGDVLQFEVETIGKAVSAVTFARLSPSAPDSLDKPPAAWPAARPASGLTDNRA